MYILKQIKPTRHSFKCRKCNEDNSDVVQPKDIIAGKAYIGCASCNTTNIVSVKLKEKTIESSTAYHDLVDELNELGKNGGSYVIEAL